MPDAPAPRPRPTPENPWPLDWMPAFLAALRNSANVRASCRAAQIDRAPAYRARDRYARFARAWDDALEDALDLLEAVAWQRAQAGSDWLLWKLLAANRSSKYGDKVEVSLDLKAEAERIAREHNLPPEQAQKIISLADHLRKGRTG